MGHPTGFIEIQRHRQPTRPVDARIRDWHEVYVPYEPGALKEQTARCMDCGIPFCHQGCPLGNLIPDWNDLVYRDRWRAAIDRLHATNNFPEFTGRLCPAPCEGSCVLGINNAPVTIKSAEAAIIERAFDEGWIAAQPPSNRTGKRVAVVGSGPAGLATADQLNRAGHLVTVFERADRIGGLLRYGIPEFKLEKRWLDRRLALMRDEGVTFKTGCHIGVDVDATQLRRQYDAIVLAGGSTVPRDLQNVPGRELEGIHFAMTYLSVQNRACEGDNVEVSLEEITARGKHVIIIGGGDTGADCLGTAHRQGARSVRQLELLQRPPDSRAPQNPWPTWPNTFRVSTAHEEGGERHYAIATERFSGAADRRVARLHAVDVNTKAPIDFEADLVLLAMGFTGPERNGVVDGLGVGLTARGTVARDANWMTNVDGVFATGDMQRGQSLIVWAIADGRSCARGVDAYLMGSSSLPAPVA
jgi:glutamate synthase (NADPH/NADH) small chain